jgi:1,4-alpha-glucan branching enzyme
VYRRYHHHELTFGLLYAWSEHFILPLSHDEVVHGKGSLIGKMPGDPWRRYANMRALLSWMWAHPGKQLLFMGGELAQEREWSHDRSLDWHALGAPEHAGVQRLVADLNAAYRGIPALWQLDDNPDGFSWIDAGNADQNVISFLRYDKDRLPGLACIANFSAVTRPGFRVGLPLPGTWREVMNSDSESYAGSNAGNYGAVTAESISWNGQPFSAEMTVPPMGVLWLVPAAPEEPQASATRVGSSSSARRRPAGK